MTMIRLDPQNPPMVNALIYYPGGYGHFKKIHGDTVVLHSVAKDRHDKGHRYAVPLNECQYSPGILEAITAAGSLHAYLAGQQRQASAPTPQSGAWVTQGKPEWWQSFEQGLIEATTWAQMQEVKSSLSATRRRAVMGLWQGDGHCGMADRERPSGLCLIH